MESPKREGIEDKKHKGKAIEKGKEGRVLLDRIKRRRNEELWMSGECVNASGGPEM